MVNMSLCMLNVFQGYFTLVAPLLQSFPDCSFAYLALFLYWDVIHMSLPF